MQILWAKARLTVDIVGSEQERIWSPLSRKALQESVNVGHSVVGRYGSRNT